jgi:pimeloyl-ACP methyl ester carboxylesterase
MDRAVVEAAMQRLLDAGGSRARSVTTQVGGARFHHLEEGEGPPVVLLHGGSGGGANWFRLLPRLAARHRVLAPDLPGFGLSAAASPSRPLGSVAAALLAEWLAQQQVRDALVVGTSFGGLVAMRLAQQVPARVGRLLLLSTAGLGRGIHPLARLATLPGIATLSMRPTRRGTRSVFRALLTTNRANLSREQQDALVNYLYVSARTAGTRYLVETMRLFGSIRGQREVVAPAELATLQQPASVVWGALDRFLPIAHAHDAARHLPNARLVIVDDAGHSPNWETPDAVLEAIAELETRTSHGG